MVDSGLRSADCTALRSINEEIDLYVNTKQYQRGINLVSREWSQMMIGSYRRAKTKRPGAIRVRSAQTPNES
jgi:hypothetical protein